MKENRDVFVDRLYAKGTDRIAVLIARLTGGDIAGTLYQYEELHNNQERIEARLCLREQV